ncbi:MAG: HAMP domain-containing histidine kinase [Oscillatoriales cyanobacterium SM2_1_8]|nr:HAMP domain-containing histidine kinase [Oscillatoriales cyanobacterium SM2_1_8]
MARFAHLVALIGSWPVPVLVRRRSRRPTVGNPRWHEVFGEAVWPSADTLPGAQGSVWQVQTAGLQPPWLGWEVAIAQDASDWARLGAEVRDRTCEVARLHQAQDEFLRRAAHELKTPLTTIGGMAGLLYREGSAAQRDRAGTLRRSVRQLAQAVDNLVDLTAAATDTLPLHFQKMDVRRLCQQAIAAARAEFAGEDLPELQLVMDSALPPLEADPRRCQQILVELLTNALKYGRGAIALTVQSTPDWWVFSVEHGGPGIPPHRQGEIFQKFGQMETLQTRQAGGGGIGLALIQHLARLHGGEVSFLSQPEASTIFSVWLPQRPPALAAPMWAGGQGVLVGSARADRLFGISQVLAGWGLRPMVARSGREVLDKVGRVPPMAVLLDEGFPDLTRVELLCLLARQGCPAVKIALTKPAAGTQGHWPEPFAPETLERFWPHPPSGLRVMAVGLPESALTLLQELGLRLLAIEKVGAIAQWWQPDVAIVPANTAVPALAVPVMVWPENLSTVQLAAAIQATLGQVRRVGLVGPQTGNVPWPPACGWEAGTPNRCPGPWRQSPRARGWRWGRGSPCPKLGDRAGRW